MEAGVDRLSDCPQSEEKENDNWKDSKEFYEQSDTTANNDDGYEGDMEGDGGLMPPPSTVP